MTLRPDLRRLEVYYRREQQSPGTSGRPIPRGNPRPFGNQETIGGHAQTGVVVEAAPTTPLIGPEPQFLLELLIVAFDAPPELSKLDQALKANVLRQGREPVLGG